MLLRSMRKCWRESDQLMLVGFILVTLALSSASPSPEGFCGISSHNTSMPPRSMDAAMGCVLGAAVGDAAGAFLEFTRQRITPELVRKAMELPGGGVFRVGPGQITDDTELALCLADGLLEADPAASFPLDAVAARYQWWLLMSHPFDVGQTCQAAMSARDSRGQGLGLAMQEQAATNSINSQANGALMRATPLAVWTHRLAPQAAAQHARLDATLSHPNKAVQDANAAFVITAGALIRHPEGGAAAAIRAVEEWAAAETDLDPSVRKWLLVDSLTGETDATDNIGWAKHAFILAFYHLRLGSSFEKAIIDTLLRGGDTDTNAAIVGGLLGALHGVDAIPESMRHKVLTWSCRAEDWEDNTNGIERPSELSASRIPALVTSLFNAAVREQEATATA